MEERIRALEQMVAELMAERVAKPEAAKRKGPKPLAERTPEQQAAHAAAKAARAAAKAASSASSVSGSSDAEGAPKKGPKTAAKAASAAGSSAAAPEKLPKAQSEGQKAWMALVSETVRDMGANGWTAWTDIKSGVQWPASSQRDDGHHVYSEGAHMGKTASQQRGGMSRASYLKSRVVGVQGLQGGWAEMEADMGKED
jgi:hypothetical protein